MTDADLYRAKLEMETDAPVRAFKRDTHLTREALFKGKVLAVLRQYEHDGRDISDIVRVVSRIEP